MNLKAVLEGLLFVVGDDGLTINQVVDILNIKEQEAKELLEELKFDYENDNHGIKISFLGNTFKLTTKEQHREFYQKLLSVEGSDNLSQAALEILAIIVYNEPVTRIQVDNIRGINSAHIIRKLVAKGLVKEVGRSDLPGRPIIYKTTNEFLDYFGLSSKDELPLLDVTIEDENEETNLFLSQYKEKNN